MLCRGRGQDISAFLYHGFRGEGSDFSLETFNCLLDVINLCENQKYEHHFYVVMWTLQWMEPRIMVTFGTSIVLRFLLQR